jgi:hypothetical protein
MRKLSTIFTIIKMRRNVKIILAFSISWMFVLLYYFQVNGTKVNVHDFYYIILLLLSKQFLIKYLQGNNP